MFDQELHESIQAFKAIGAEIELQPILAFLAATRARTVLDGSAVQRQQPTGTLPEPIEPTLKIRSNMSKQPFVITPKNCLRPLKVLGEHAAVLASGEAP